MRRETASEKLTRRLDALRTHRTTFTLDGDHAALFAVFACVGMGVIVGKDYPTTRHVAREAYDALPAERLNALIDLVTEQAERLVPPLTESSPTHE